MVRPIGAERSGATGIGYLAGRRAGAFFRRRQPLSAVCIRPAIRRLEQANTLEPQVIAVGVAIHAVEKFERQFRQVLGSWHAIENDRLVIGNAAQEFDNAQIASVDEKRVIPTIDEMLPGQRLDLREIHDHAIGRVAVLADDISRQSNLDSITMTVQMAALAFVVRNPVTGIELEAAGNAH